MYWTRTGSTEGLVLFLLLCAIWSLGGWLLAAHAFRLRASERLVAGASTGLLLFIALSNLLANLTAPNLALAGWGAGLLILLGGAAAAWKDRRRSGPWLEKRDWHAWPVLAGLGVLAFLFTLLGRGLALFDDYLHLPLVSVMGAGDIPPHFYLNPGQPLAYHYGLQVLAAEMVRLGGFFPWSAWDFSKALAIALTLVLAWMWYRRMTQAALWGGLLVTLGGGARWLLLLLPLGLLARISASVQLSNTGLDAGPDLLSALARPWPAEGAGPYPFAFAYHNGIFTPQIFALGSSGALPAAAILLLLLLTRRVRQPLLAVPTLSLIFATLALSGENLFVFLWAGIALAGLIFLLRAWRRRAPLPRAELSEWAAILAISGVLSLIQGAFITEGIRSLLLRLQGAQVTTGGSVDYFSLSLRWPPAIVSGHLGELSLFNPLHWPVALAEMGPVLLLAPLVTWVAWRRIFRRDWLFAGLGLAALLSVIVAIFFRYGDVRASTRLSGSALWIWALLGFPLAWAAFRRARPWAQGLLRLGYAAALVGGFAILAVQFTTLSAPQLSYYIDPYDAQLSNRLWNRLPAQAQILDAIPERAVALFGRASRSSLDFYHPLEDWAALVENPDPAAVAQAGYQYIYMDRTWWRKLSDEQRRALESACVTTAEAVEPDDGNFRRLLDVQKCK